MNSVEVDTARYHAELRDTDPDETFACKCGAEVPLDEVKCVREWHVTGWIWNDVCAECAQEEE